MQQPTPNRVQEIRLIKNIPNLTIVESVPKQLASPTISKEISSPSELESPTSKKKRVLALKKAADVEQARTELNNYIDMLDTKVYKLVEKHQAEFLVAYRNHIKKVREEMEEIRNKALTNANSTVSQTEKIEALQKQLTIFREESLKLFEKVNEKQGTIYSLKTKINELESQKAFLERSVRELIKRNKQLQGLNYDNQVKKSLLQSNSNTNQKEFFISRPQPEDFQDLKNMYRFDMNKAATTLTRSRPYTTAINSKGASIRSRNHSIQAHSFMKNADLIDQREQIENKIDQILRNEADEKIIRNLKEQINRILMATPNQLGATSIIRQTYQKRESMKKPRSYVESKTYAKSSELEEYFSKSIEAVRKEITRRRGLKNMNFYSQYANLSLAQFKKVDFFRLLELLLSNDKIIAALHRAVFERSKQYL